MSDAPKTEPTWKEVYADPLVNVGWFVPPFIQMGTLSRMVGGIRAAGSAYGQDDLERDLESLYGPVGLASMVLLRYPKTPIIQDYASTIAEAAEAHVLGLDHVAVAGLIPVIEGAGRQLASQRGLSVPYHVKQVFIGLTESCKEYVITHNVGAVAEVICVLESFRSFATGYLYADSGQYPLSDKTNRHGITHGAYADADYGRPLNFFKTIAAIDFLTFVSTLTNGGSWFAPDLTPRVFFLTQHWLTQREARSQYRNEPMPQKFEHDLREVRSFRNWLERLPPDEAVRL